MQPNRRARLQSVLLAEVNRVVSRDLRDPRIPPLTFTRVEVTEDGGQATVYYTHFGGEDHLKTLVTSEGSSNLSENEIEKKIHDLKLNCQKGLNSAAGFIRREVGSVLDLRIIPTFVFREDKGLENTLKVHELLKKVSNKE